MKVCTLKYKIRNICEMCTICGLYFKLRIFFKTKIIFDLSHLFRICVGRDLGVLYICQVEYRYVFVSLRNKLSKKKFLIRKKK